MTLRGSEVRTLATVGAFRVVPAGDLRDGQDRPLDPHRGDLRHLRDQGLVETMPANPIAETQNGMQIYLSTAFDGRRHLRQVDRHE